MSDRTLMPLPADARLIDLLHLGRPHVIGTYLLLGDQPALIDPGPASTLDTIEAGLAMHGLALADIQTILLTHIHLDHAGATGTLLRRYPHIRVYVHMRGAPHLVAPEKLIHSATRLYGDAMQRLWGPIRPVPEQAINVLSGGETLRIGGAAVRPGSATPAGSAGRARRWLAQLRRRPISILKPGSARSTCCARSTLACCC